MNSLQLLAKIEERLGFVPPFFSPAAEHPEVLANLWQQTESAYLDNALPTLFKEKLAALLGRYCEVPYCLLCHTCSLRPLGMSGPAVLDFLAQPHLSDEEVHAALDRLRACNAVLAVEAADDADERDVFSLASAIYFAGPLASAAMAALRARLSPADYRNLIVFISYNKMCHAWMAAHPEVSYELDQRYLSNFGPLFTEAPGLAALTGQDPRGTRERLQVAQVAHRSQIENVVAARTSEATSAVQISERRLLDVLTTLQGRLAVATEHAAEKDEAAKELHRTATFAEELLAIVSHDLRNPLNAVLLSAHVILQLAAGNQTIAKPAGQVIRSANRAARLIHELLDFSLARTGGGIPVQLTSNQLEEVVRDAMDDVRTAHPERAIVVVEEGAGRADLDTDRIAQVLSNLLANAVSHGRPEAPIEIFMSGDSETVTLAIRNQNKAGSIPAELLPVLFDPFKRGGPRTLSGTRSVGLGLYIVREIVRAHRGSVDVESAGTSTTFTVRLPRHATAPAIPSVSPK